MRKAKSVIILISIQFLIAIALTLINPVSDYIVRTKGTEYIFLTDSVELYGDFSDYVELSCSIKIGFDKELVYDYYAKQYAIIETDENGLSYISGVSDNQPREGAWLGNKTDSFHHFTWHSKTIDYDLFSKAEEIAAYSDEKMWHISDEYEITLNISVYKGKAVLNKILIDGIEVEEFLNDL